METSFNLPKEIINIHVHGRDLNQSHKTTVAQTLYEAALSGVKVVGFMPNTDPAIISRGVLETYFQRIDYAVKSFCYPVRPYIWFGVTDSNLAECEAALDDPRVIGLKIYPLSKAGISVTTGKCGVANRGTILAAMELARSKNKAVAIHADDPEIISVEGYTIRAEVEYVRMIIELMRQVPGVRVIICHVSCRASAELIIQAQADGLSIAIELCAQYLWFDNQGTGWRNDINRSYYKCFNVLRSPEDRKFLISLLPREDVLAIVSSDHAPHAEAEKEGDNPPGGIPSLHETVPVVLSYVINMGISEKRVAELISFNAADFLGIKVDRTLEKTLIEEREDDFVYNRAMVVNPWLGSRLCFPKIENCFTCPEVLF